MSRGIKAVALLACAALCAVTCGCNVVPPETAEMSEVFGTTAATSAAATTVKKDETPKPLSSTPALCYDKSDSLSPYAAKTRVNRALTPLLFEGLTAVDASYTAKLCLAKEIKKTDKTHLTVTLKSDVKFSDKSALKAADVVASFSLARQSETYADLVRDVASVTAKDDKTLTVTLSSAVPYYEAALSFPVVKTAGKTVIGTGPYRLNAKKTALEQNPCAAKKAKISSFSLADISRREKQQYALETGEICAYGDDLVDGVVPRTVTGITLTPTTLPYLVFLGFNAGRKPWDSAEIRASLSQAVSRNEIAAAGFSGYAQGAATPFCPTFAGLEGISGAEMTANAAKAVAVWQSHGYNKTENGAVKNRMKAELICCKDNAMHKAAAEEIAKELRVAGMEITVKALSESDYKGRLSSGNFDLYLGEVRLPATLSLDAVLTSYGAAAYGMSSGGFALWEQYKSGKLNTKKFVEAFLKEAPFLPLCYAQGLMLSSDRIAGVSPAGVSEYNGIEQWTFT